MHPTRFSNNAFTLFRSRGSEGTHESIVNELARLREIHQKYLELQTSWLGVKELAHDTLVNSRNQLNSLKELKLSYPRDKRIEPLMLHHKEEIEEAINKLQEADKYLAHISTQIEAIVLALSIDQTSSPSNSNSAPA